MQQITVKAVSSQAGEDRSQASMMPLPEALSRTTLETRKTSFLRPAIASTTISSAAPQP
jgi:hypothetical protein